MHPNTQNPIARTDEHPSKRSNAEIARAIVEHGHPFVTGWYDDGTVESGPRGGTIYGYRWGQLYVDAPDYALDCPVVTSRKCGEGPSGPGGGWPIIFGGVRDEQVVAALRELSERDLAERSKRS